MARKKYRPGLPCNPESGRSRTKIKNHDYAAIFTGHRSNRGAGFFWVLLSGLGGFHRHRPLCRGLSLQGALGNGRARADAAEAGLSGAGAQSQSDDRDSERGEVATCVTHKKILFHHGLAECHGYGKARKNRKKVTPMDTIEFIIPD